MKFTKVFYHQSPSRQKEKSLWEISPIVFIQQMPTNNAIELTWKRSRQRPKSRRSACRTDSRTFSVTRDVLCNSSNNHMHELTVETLVSFLGRSRLQYLMPYSMQIRRGKAWEIWLLAVMSGSQKIDTWGALLNEESQSLFLYMYYWSEGWEHRRTAEKSRLETSSGLEWAGECTVQTQWTV